MMKFVRILGSLSFAIFLISVLAVTLIVSTSLESLHGTPFAQRFFYQAGWFDVFLSLFGVNILCSTLLRFPLKKKHTGFVITHIGLLTLLAGSLLSRFLGVDGQMALYENQASDQILHNTYELIVHASDENISSFELASHPGQEIKKLKTLTDGSAVFLRRIWEDAEEVQDIKEGGSSDPLNHAVSLTLKSERVGANQSVELLESDASGTDSSSNVSMGPAIISLSSRATPSEAKPNRGGVEGSADSSTRPADSLGMTSGNFSPILKITEKDSNETTLIYLPPKEDEIFLKNNRLKVERIKYYPNARVGDNFQLTNISGGGENPAVEFDISDGKARRVHYVKFALYPEFESMHGKASKNMFPVTADLVAPVEKLKQSPKGPSLTIHYDDAGHWTYESKSSQGILKGEIEAGKSYATGWMDFSFTVESLWEHAVLSRRVKHTLGMSKGRLAVEVSLEKDGKELMKDWVLEDSPATLESESGKLIFVVRPKVLPVPFILKLKDFRKIDYPGTDHAASFESDVSLHDAAENLTIEKTIKMNKPLDYKGYRIFQSSYMQDADQGEGSVFTVAKNPGVPFIYSGACIMFAGIFITFFIPSLSTLKH